MTDITKGLYLTEHQWYLMYELIKKSIEYDEFDTPDYTDEDLMRYYHDRAVLHNTLWELVS